MVSCTVTRTRETTLLSHAVSLPSVAELCPQTAVRPIVEMSVMTDVASWRGQPDTDRRGITAPTTAALQGGAIAGLGFGFVTDHPYSTRLGSASCSPPV
jgi:hypothetical protein